MNMNNKLMTILCVTALAAGSMSGIALAKQTYTPGAGVANSPHNINNVTPNGDAYGRVCAYCHTPHHAIVDGAIAEYNPLWSHQVNSDTYAPYQSRTAESALAANQVVAGDPLVGPSRLCMSCHDGVVAVSEHYGNASADNGSAKVGDNWGEISVGDALGNKLTNDHPIGFDYDKVVTADKGNGTLGTGLKSAATTFNVTIAGTGVNYGGTHTRAIGDLMYKTAGGTKVMTCASCHDVHNNENNDDYLLINKQAGSAICLTCHIK